VDDFALFSNDQSLLQEQRQAIEAYLAQLHLRIHPIKSQIFATNHGANFVGFRVLPHQVRVRNDSLRRGCQRLRHYKARVLANRLPPEKLQKSLQSWFSHLKHGNTWRHNNIGFRVMYAQARALQFVGVAAFFGIMQRGYTEESRPIPVMHPASKEQNTVGPLVGQSRTAPFWAP
jgi:hypothetical protein